MNLKELENFVDLTNFDADQKRDVNWLLKELPKEPKKHQLKKLKQQTKAIGLGVPLAYVLGKAPFLDYVFFVNHSTLIPRFETELLVDKLQKRLENVSPDFEILDLCAGSGAIGISLQKKLNCKVTLADINPKCVKIIKKNAKKMQANVKVLKSDMLKNIKQTFDLIVCNPPYIKTEDIKTLDASVKNFEPHLALDGGNDGLKFYKTLANSSHKFLKPNGILALEIGWDQANDVAKLLNENFEQIEIQKDYSNLDRFIFAKRR